MITNKKTFAIGLVMLITFALIYTLMMSPIFGDGRHGLQYADDTFNSLSKGSAYFIDEEMHKAEQISGTVFDIQLTAKTTQEAAIWADIHRKNGANAMAEGTTVAISGDLGRTLQGLVADCDSMYHNQGHTVHTKYGMDERQAIYAAYQSLQSMGKEFDKQGQFALTQSIQSAILKAVEPAYNYYGIEAKKVANHKGTVSFLMIFYLIYTIWFGFGIYYLFDGLGITTTKASQKAEA